MNRSRTSNERPDDAGLLVVISGPSGAGKSTICREAMKRVERLEFSVSYTTRPSRPGEIHGKDYFFVDAPTFDRMIVEGAFLEWATVHGNKYGTSRAFVEAHTRAGATLLLDIDTQGAARVRKAFPESVLVFCLAPSAESLENRLRQRGTDQPDVIARRLRAARNEIRQAVWYDYVIVNDVLERAVDDFVSVLRAERCRVRRSPRQVERILAAYGVEADWTGENSRAR